jgi:beta-galactosidase
MVKIQVSWAIDEKKEGAIDLSNVMRVVSDARDYGLKVYFGVTMEQAPAWLWQKYPDAYLVYNAGERHFDQLQYVIFADGKPGPCWHHPGEREAAIRFLGAVGSQVGQYDNVLIWNVWQELGFWPMKPGNLGFCYCENSLLEFPIWLQARYGSIQKLNEAWKSGYGTLAEVIPPRVGSDLPPYLDFRYFMEDVYLPYVLRWKADALRTSDPRHRPVFAHADGATLGSGQQWHQAEALDFFGCSEYPAWRPRSITALNCGAANL